MLLISVTWVATYLPVRLLAIQVLAAATAAAWVIGAHAHEAQPLVLVAL